MDPTLPIVHSIAILLVLLVFLRYDVMREAYITGNLSLSLFPKAAVSSMTLPLLFESDRLTSSQRLLTRSIGFTTAKFYLLSIDGASTFGKCNPAIFQPSSRERQYLYCSRKLPGKDNVSVIFAKDNYCASASTEIQVRNTRDSVSCNNKYISVLVQCSAMTGKIRQAARDDHSLRSWMLPGLEGHPHNVFAHNESTLLS